MSKHTERRSSQSFESQVAEQRKTVALDLVDELRKMTQQRDALLTACKEAIDLIKTLEYDGEPVRKNNYKTIEAAIAKAAG